MQKTFTRLLITLIAALGVVSANTGCRSGGWGMPSLSWPSWPSWGKKDVPASSIAGTRTPQPPSVSVPPYQPDSNSPASSAENASSLARSTQSGPYRPTSSAPQNYGTQGVASASNYYTGPYATGGSSRPANAGSENGFYSPSRSPSAGSPSYTADSRNNAYGTAGYGTSRNSDSGQRTLPGSASSSPMPYGGSSYSAAARGGYGNVGATPTTGYGASATPTTGYGASASPATGYGASATRDYSRTASGGSYSGAATADTLPSSSANSPYGAGQSAYGASPSVGKYGSRNSGLTRNPSPPTTGYGSAPADLYGGGSPEVAPTAGYGSPSIEEPSSAANSDYSDVAGGFRPGSTSRGNDLTVPNAGSQHATNSWSGGANYTPAGSGSYGGSSTLPSNSGTDYPSTGSGGYGVPATQTATPPYPATYSR